MVADWIKALKETLLPVLSMYYDFFTKAQTIQCFIATQTAEHGATHGVRPNSIFLTKFQASS